MMKILICFLLACPVLVFADVSGDLNNYYNSLGYATNVTSAHAYEGQQAGYYSGGSLYVRAKSRTISPLHIDLPSLKAGCGGIDMFMGGASFINSQQLVNFANNIMSNAVPYFFQLALQTMIPQANDVMNRLQYWAQQINQANMNSCETAQDLVGGLWPKHTAAQEQICRDLSMQQNRFADWAEARQGCGAGGQGNSILNGQPDAVKKAAGITHNINIVWSALKDQNFLQSDPELAEFFMSLSGTLVFNDKSNATVYPSLAGKSDVISALLYGGDAMIYRCSDAQKCLNLSQINIKIAPGNALTQRVSSLLMDIQRRYQTDQPITDEEKGFLNKTTTPVMKFIQVALMSGTNINTSDYAALISQDLLSQYLSDVLALIQEVLSDSRYSDSQQTMQNSLATAQRFVQDLKNNVQFKVIAATSLVQSSMQTEQLVAGQLSGQLQANLGI